ncbi:MAG: hypothetical protein ACRDJE_24560 [Dehalococcoidia bacterium]
MARNTPPRVRHPSPNAAANIRRLLRGAKNVEAVTVQVDDLYGLLDELQARNAKIAALWREMSEPLPGLEVAGERRPLG